MAKLCLGALAVCSTQAAIAEDVEGLGLLQVQAGKKHNLDPVHEWGYHVGAPGWYASGVDENCEVACGKQQLVCTEEAMFAHFQDVDTNEKVQNLIKAVGGHTDATNCKVLNKAPMPAWNDRVCFRGQEGRVITTERCTAQAGPAGVGKQRLCYCHAEAPVTTTQQPSMCCRQYSPVCLACANGQSVEEWCQQNPNSPVADRCPEDAKPPVMPPQGTCKPCTLLDGHACTQAGNADLLWCQSNCEQTLISRHHRSACGSNGETGTHCICTPFAK